MKYCFEQNPETANILVLYIQIDRILTKHSLE